MFLNCQFRLDYLSLYKILNMSYFLLQLVDKGILLFDFSQKIVNKQFRVIFIFFGIESSHLLFKNSFLWLVYWWFLLNA